jgi:hypothetical protein
MCSHDHRRFLSQTSYADISIDITQYSSPSGYCYLQPRRLTATAVAFRPERPGLPEALSHLISWSDWFLAKQQNMEKESG